jgi:uncharacterized protein (UPF0332 family)
MRRPRFFAKLLEEGKLGLVDPSEEMKEAYFRKSESYLISAKLLLENDRLEESVSMAYYCMYYALLGLFFKVGIKCENHSAAIILLRELFDMDNSEISSAKRERIDKQYYIDFSVTRVEVGELIEEAERFNAKILDFAARLNSEKITRFRWNFRRLLNGL